MTLTKNHKEKPSLVCGYTTRKHLCIDLDNTSYFKVLRLVEMLMKDYPEVGHCLIIQSSTPKMKELSFIHPKNGYTLEVVRHNYHAVFNNFIPYNKSCEIIECMAFLGLMNKDYVKIREMRQDMTLRTSKKINADSVTPKPKPVKYVINQYSKTQDSGIHRYMQLLNCF